ncbi:MAG TPA: sterol desaturase family protein [Flavobacteriales bacterium]
MDAIALSIPVFFLLMGIELAWSAWKGRKLYRFNDFVANLGCGIGSQVVGAFTKTLIFAAYLWVYEHWRIFTLEESALTWIWAFLFTDFLYYWFHRSSHGINAFWAAHIVHHQSEEYNLSVALRQSWFQGLISWWFYLPMAWFGFHPITILTVGAVNTLYQFWIHTRAIGKLGPLEWVLNTPSHHRVHHGSDPKYIDKNHAGTLIIWDKLFGTFQKEEEEPTYGITEPLTTWDPVRANLHYWSDLGGLAARSSGWKDKVRVFLKPPGWRPAELGGFQGPKAKDPATYTKFDTAVARSINGYVAAQFLVLLAVTTFFLFRQKDLEQWQQWAMAGIILLSVMDLGILLEGASTLGLFALEILRIVSLALLMHRCAHLFGPGPWSAIAVLFASLSGLAWWLVHRTRRAGTPV